ncbi:B12-binding domain-containing radical SAM protein [Patescibacteria group bacterium]|nr:B12-binding domain-containing radical SAM protein [Patescibacteria group bacterium]MBU1256204.1 B12-binding domain-containing radical SAM protein [Patescibacteria group bacterium]MBU1457730.1 B12-binding domain-containing radical SAM protein [Patescibacteria group bacterium]
MKKSVAICYPPLDTKKGIPLLGQNRQFQWANDPWYAYPVVPAYGATMLHKAGFSVSWLDGIAKEQTYSTWLAELIKIKPDIIIIETKTPVIKYHWKMIEKIKSKLPQSNVVLMGDHVTALPEESFKKCPVDFVITGGDFDFLMLSIANHLAKKTKLCAGIYYRQGKKILNTGKFKLNNNLDKLPFIDRDLTRWKLYAYKNSNYIKTPGTYTMFGRDCWWGKCTFCSWTTLFPGKNFRVMSVKRALDEIGHILDNYPVVEIMDDSGTFPVGEWLRDFCKGIIKRGYHKKIQIDCNMRFNTGLTQEDYHLMRKAGFRFLLYGLESANQETLNRLNKNLKVAQITQYAKIAKQAGLWPHATAMVGYPWETKEQAQNTINLAKDLFKKGYIDTLQATVVIPYPGTPLFKQCQKNNWLKTTDWNQYDMRMPIMKTTMSDNQINALVRDIYNSIWTPQFVLRKLKEGLTDWNKFKYYVRLALKFFSKKLDFAGF